MWRRVYVTVRPSIPSFGRHMAGLLLSAWQAGDISQLLHDRWSAAVADSATFKQM